MRTITVQHNIYKYNELSEEAKGTAKQWYLDNQDSYIFEEMVNEDLYNLFGSINNDLAVQFSLSYCQGDGLSIYGHVSVEDFINCIEGELAGELKQYSGMLSEEEKAKLLEYAEYVPHIELPENKRYEYCIANEIDYYYQLCNDGVEEEEDIDIDTKLLWKFNDILRGAFTALCKTYEEDGYKFFYEVDDDTMEEMCEANEWEFYKDGRIY